MIELLKQTNKIFQDAIEAEEYTGGAKSKDLEEKEAEEHTWGPRLEDLDDDDDDNDDDFFDDALWK